MVAICVRGLKRSFGAVRAVDDLHFDVTAGRVFGFLGPNGAGKTTTLHMLLGIIAPEAGHAEVLGLPVATHAQEIRRRCGVLLEHDGLYERLSARDNLVYHGRIYGLSRDDARQRGEALLAGAGWTDRGQEPVAKWSRGMKRRLAVLRAFVTEPEILFLDEPTSGFDPKAAADLRGFLRAISRERGITVFLTTHNMQEAEVMCDEVAVLREGRVVAQGRPGSLRDQAIRVRIAGSGFDGKVVQSLKRRKDVAAIEATDEGLLLHLVGDTPAAPIVAGLVRAGAAIEGVQRIRSSLEEDFIALMENA